MLQPTYSFEELKLGSQLVRDLIQEKETIAPLVEQFYDPDKIPEQISLKHFDRSKRELLVKVLKQQNEGVTLFEPSKKNIDALLDEQTFTITTGHQLNLLTGPLYAIYKIAQCVSISNNLNQLYPDKRFVPVFWMATEDHDFEEINHVHLFGKKIAWEKTDQENVVAGRLKLDSIEPFLEEIQDKFKDPTALTLILQFTSLYRRSQNLAEATRKLINGLLGNMGLVIIDGDDPQLKSLFRDTMIQEVENETCYHAVMESNRYLEDQGYHQQVFVRACNLFFIDKDGVRKRVRKEEGQFFIEDDPIKKGELVSMINEGPENFSPNALYRPLYQETVLPNLAYIGGAGEMAYWLQLKGLFDHFKVTFPMLKLRDSVLLYRNTQADLMKEYHLDLMDLKLGVDQIVKDIAVNQAEQDLQLTEAEADLLKAKSKVIEKVHQVNPSLETMVEAEFVKMINTLERIESKLIKAEKAKYEQTQQKLVKLRDQFFPENSFQERHENFLPYYLKDVDFILKILSNLAPEKFPVIRTIEI